MKRRRMWAGALGAIILLTSACGDDDADSETAADDVTTTIAETTATTVALDSDAEPLIGEFLEIEPGSHRVDIVGTPFTFSTDRPMFVPRNGLGWFVVAEPDSQGPDDRDIVVLRVSALADPSALDRPMNETDDSWPASDFAGWLDELPAEVVVSDRQDVTLGGLDATRAEIELVDTECAGLEFCRAFATNQGIITKDLQPGSTYRVWHVDQGDEDPIVVIVGINRDEDAAFFDVADDVLASLSFGEIAPNPLTAVPAGDVDLPFLGGISTELAEPGVTVANPRGGASDPNDVGVVIPGRTSVIGLLSDPRDPEGRPLATGEAVLANVADVGGVVTELDPITIDGIEARVVDVASPNGPIALTFRDEPNDGWRLGPKARWWILDHPERGTLVVIAEVVIPEGIDETFADVVGQAEAIVSNLAFV